MSEPINWASLSPRERDALVAERVMGLSKSDARQAGLNCPTCGYDGQWSSGANWRTLVPQYSTDIATAWQVVEKLKEKYEFQLLLDHGQWSFSVFRGDKFTVYGSTVPEVICLAALRAVGVEVE